MARQLYIYLNTGNLEFQYQRNFAYQVSKIAQLEVYKFKYSQHDLPVVKMKLLELIGVGITV